jgi:formamidopyrimidine-DNA glycosylase
MPELPEVEILVRHLAPQLQGAGIRACEVRKPRLVRPHPPDELTRALRGATVLSVRRRAKFLLFDLRSRTGERTLVGHLGMTGRMFLQSPAAPVPRHAAVVFDLGDRVWVFEDPRGFGRLTFDGTVLEGLGPEPWDETFSAAGFRAALAGSRQPIKVRLLDQSVVAGVGNIYASEALYRARISPRRAAGRLVGAEVARLREAIREVLAEAIRVGSTLPLDFAGREGGDGLFYYGREAGVVGSDTERLLVYDRAGLPCAGCGTPIRRIVQAARSTFYCPQCQSQR